MIAVLDYGIGNIMSIANMLKKGNADAVVTFDEAVIDKCDKIILPGIGNFDYCMQQLKRAPFYDLLLKKVLIEKTPVLGVCVGCQMLMETSEEGGAVGLGWIEGTVIKFNKEKLPATFKVPHMDWTDIEPRPECKLYKNIEEPRFYFVHSYHLKCDNDFITATANYGYTFAASVAKENIMGVQFHPEKSHKFGMQLYSNFVNNY